MKAVTAISMAEITKLIDECQQYTSENLDKQKAVTDLGNLLKQRKDGSISSQIVLDYINIAFLIPKNPIFSGSVFRVNRVKKYFDKAKAILV